MAPETPAGPEGISRQTQVRRTMLEAGGYWRPLAAVARLLEELGELVELLVQTGPGAGDLASELADLWIITTALADQFRIEVPEPQGPRPVTSGRPSASGLVVAAGQIARVVNYYDGPKLPRSPGELPSLTESIGAFHAELGALCGALQISLSHAVDEKFEVIYKRDMKRFARESSDPSTSPTLALLPPARRQEKLWGAPAPPPSGGIRELAAAIAPPLLAFTRAAGPEGLEGFVIAAASCPGTAELDRWLAELSGALGELDPARENTAAMPQRPRFNGMALNIEVLPVEGAEQRGIRTLVILTPGAGRAEHADG